MTEESYRFWDTLIKCLGGAAVIGSGLWTVHTYRVSRASELDQQKYTQQQDQEARTKDQNAFIFHQQSTLYFDAARSAATLAVGLDPILARTSGVDQKSVQEARTRFQQLYWGELVVVEDRRVELAMIAFQSCLKNTTNCSKSRPTVNQREKPISSERLDKVGEPLLSNLSLELGACIKDAMQEDRGIKFGEIKAAGTVCPYD